MTKILGPVAWREQVLKGRLDSDVYLINRENVPWLVEFCAKNLKDWPFDMVVIDESSSFKNRSTKRWRALNKVMNRVTTLVQLTGTPTPQGVHDLWSQVYLLDRGMRLGRTLTAFRNRWMARAWHNPYVYEPRPGAENEIRGKVADICLSLRAQDYLDIPPVVENVVHVDLSDNEKKLYDKMKNEYVVELDQEVITAVNAGSLWSKLCQMANGAVYTEHPEWKEFHRRKLDALMEIHELVDGYLMIAYSYTCDIQRIAREFKKNNVEWRLLRKAEDAKDWNDGKIHRLVFHPASAGHGLNLHESGCRDLVWFGLTPNLEYYEQARARIAGGLRSSWSEKPVVEHKILARRTTDTSLNVLLKRKSNVQLRLVNAISNMSKRSMEQRGLIAK